MHTKFSENPQIKVVNNFLELVTTKFQGLNNAMCWQRDLSGDFKEIASKLSLEENITEISIEEQICFTTDEDDLKDIPNLIEKLKLLRDFYFPNKESK